LINRIQLWYCPGGCMTCFAWSPAVLEDMDMHSCLTRTAKGC
jgi:hypothetical protein